MTAFQRIAIAIFLSSVVTGAHAATWKHEVNANGVCIVHNQEMPWPFIVIALSNEVVRIAMFNPEWESIQAGREYTLNWEFSSGDSWTLKFDGSIDDDGTISLRGRYAQDKGTKFMEDFVKADSVRVLFNGNVVVDQSLAGSMLAYYRAIECRRAKDPFDGDSGKRSDPFKQSKARDPFAS